MAYAGYLLKIGGASGTVLPLSYFKAESYKATPDQRMDVDSGHDTEGNLHRNVVEHTATKIEIETVENLTDTDVATLNTLLGVTGLRRDVTVQYYDNESNSYKVADCYMPDVTYPIKRADASHIVYGSIRYAFIEY